MAQGSECVICAELNIHPQHITDALVSLEGLQRPIRRIEGRAAFVLGPGHSIFGHWLVDFLPKLQVLTESGYDISRLSYLVPKSTPSWGMELFGLVGIRQDQLIIFDHDSEVVEMEELLLPTFLHNGVRFAPIFRESVASLKRSILTGSESMSSIAKSKIYISRAKASQTRPFQNGSSAEAIAEDYGFAICHPEKLDIRDQIVLFASAACIIGEYGSAHHLSIFAPPGAVVCGWRGSEYHPGFIQSGVGCALSQPTGYVFGETDTSDGRGAYFIADQTIRDCLDTVFRGHFFE
jgi:capsular polysaccharide biosynthesis protein